MSHPKRLLKYTDMKELSSFVEKAINNNQLGKLTAPFNAPTFQIHHIKTINTKQIIHIPTKQKKLPKLPLTESLALMLNYWNEPCYTFVAPLKTYDGTPFLKKLYSKVQQRIIHDIKMSCPSTSFREIGERFQITKQATYQQFMKHQNYLFDNQYSNNPCFLTK